VRGGQVLPLPTRALLATSDWVASWGGWFLLAVGLAGLALVGPWRRAAWQRRRHRLWLRLPGLGSLLIKQETARFIRTLALLAGSGVPLLEALRLAAQTVRNRALAASLEQVAARVREGATLSRSLAGSGRFPPLAIRLIASGERAGRLDAMLEEAADQLDRELQTLMQVAIGLLGPLVILLVGTLVLFIVLAILLPIFEMNQLIR